MLKQTFMSLALLLLSFTAVAQSQSSSFSTSRDNKWTISVKLGSGNYINEALLDYDIILPGYNGLTDIGLDVDPALCLSIGSSFNDNSLTNIAGLEIGFFILENFEISISASAAIGSTPSIDYIEGTSYDSTSSLLDIPAYDYVEARLDQRCIGSMGLKYYLDTKSDRVNLYFGAAGVYCLGALETSLPYTGETTSSGEAVEIYQSYISGATVQSATGMVVAGVEYLLSENLVLGFEFAPASYSFGLISMYPQGLTPYHVSHTDVKVFNYPELKLGIRF